MSVYPIYFSLRGRSFPSIFSLVCLCFCTPLGGCAERSSGDILSTGSAQYHLRWLIHSTIYFIPLRFHSRFSRVTSSRVWFLYNPHSISLCTLIQSFHINFGVNCNTLQCRYFEGIQLFIFMLFKSTIVISEQIKNCNNKKKNWIFFY